MVDEERLRRAFLEEPLGFRLNKFSSQIYALRHVGRMQLELDRQYRKAILRLRRKIYKKKIKPLKFWEEYKKILLKSVSKNNKYVQTLINGTDKEMKKRLKKIEQEEQKERKGEKLLIDLRLPE